jgi:zinc protease
LIEGLTVQQVQQAAERYFVRNNRTVGLFIPSEEAERVQIPEAPDLMTLFKQYKGREAIADGEQFDPEPLAIEQRTERGELLDGIKYALLPKKTRGGTVSLMLTLRFGTGDTLVDKIGAVELLGLLMSRGTDKLDYQQLQDELTRLRAELSINSTIGLLQTTIKTKREFLPEVIALLGNVLRHPRLDSSELEVIRRQIVTQLRQGTTEPQALAPRQVRKALAPYGKDDVRYVMSIEEEIAMYEAVKIDEIRNLHEKFLSNQAGEVSLVGDFDAEEVKALLVAQLKDWNTEQPYVRVGRGPHPEIDGAISLIETPDKANAFLFSSQQYALSDDDEAYASLVLGNFILGGGSLSSRLGDRVRQQEGLSYGVRSSVVSRTKDGRVDFILYAITNPENKDRLVEVIREELDRLRKDGVTEDELQRAKESYLQASRVRRTGDGALAGELVGTIFNERTMEYHAEHERRIQAATVQSVNQAIRSYIVPEKMVTAIAGDFAAAEKTDNE